MPNHTVIEITPLMQQLRIAPASARGQIIKRAKAKAEAKGVRRKLLQATRILSARIQALPQELQDEILEYALYFQAGGGKVVRIDKDYKPPLGLQISWQTRAKFANAYHSNTIFRMGDQKEAIQRPSHPYMTDRQDAAHMLCQFWLETLVACERHLIRTIRLEHKAPSSTIGFTARQLMLDKYAKILLEIFRGTPCGFDLRPGVLVMWMPEKDEEDWYRCQELAEHDVASLRLWPYTPPTRSFDSINRGARSRPSLTAFSTQRMTLGK